MCSVPQEPYKAWLQVSLMFTLIYDVCKKVSLRVSFLIDFVKHSCKGMLDPYIQGKKMFFLMCLNETSAFKCKFKFHRLIM